MDEVVSHILSYKFVLMCVIVWIITFFIRRVVETARPSLKKAADETEHKQTYTNRLAVWWNDVILHAIPVVLGSLLAIIMKDMAPDTVWYSRAIYGVLPGWLSAFIYKLLRQTLKKRIGLDLPGGSIPPPPEETPETPGE